MPNDCHLFSMSGPESEIVQNVQNCAKMYKITWGNFEEKKNKSGQIWTNLDKAGEEVGSNVFGRGFSPLPLRELRGVWNKRADKYAANNNGRATTSSCSSWSMRREETKEFCPEERKMVDGCTEETRDMDATGCDAVTTQGGLGCGQFSAASGN